MATRKMTFTLPEELAAQFTRRVAPRKRSHYLAEALSEKLAERDRELLQACEIANSDPEVEAIEREFDALPGTIEEPWAEGRPRPKERTKARSKTR